MLLPLSQVKSHIALIVYLKSKIQYINHKVISDLIIKSPLVHNEVVVPPGDLLLEGCELVPVEAPGGEAAQPGEGGAAGQHRVGRR